MKVEWRFFERSSNTLLFIVGTCYKFGIASIMKPQVNAGMTMDTATFAKAFQKKSKESDRNGFFR